MHPRPPALAVLLAPIGVLALGLAVAAVTACDWLLPGECLSTGHVWGPCDLEAGVAPLGCGKGLTCVATTDGGICTPTSESACSAENALACAEWIGPVSWVPDYGMCFIFCDKDAPGGGCAGGTICDDRHGICVWPWPDPCVGEGLCWGGAAPECFEVSGSFGPCTTDAECASGLTCIISDDAASGYCAAACEADGCEQDCFPTWQTKCTEDKVCTWPCKVNADCGPGMVCATEDGAGACMWPCLGTGQCWDGTACVDECA